MIRIKLRGKVKEAYEAHKKAHGEEGSKYISPTGEEHDDPWEASGEWEPTPEEAPETAKKPE